MVTRRKKEGLGLRVAVAASVMAILGAAGPTGASAETLTDAFTMAYTTNPQLLSQRARLRAVDEQVPLALSGSRPTVTSTIEAGKSNTKSDTSLSSGRVNTSPRSAQIGFSQPIFRGLQTINDFRRARATIGQERALLTSVEQTVLLQTVTAFMNVVRDQSLLELQIKNEQVLRRQLQATRDRFQVGEVTRTDVSQAEARLAEATAARIQAEGTLQITRANYRRVVGKLPGRLTPPRKVVRVPKSLQSVVVRARTNEPNVVAARFAERAARYTVRQLSGQFLPTVTLNGSLSRNVDTGSRGSRTSTSSITAQIAIPLYQAGSVSAQVRQAKQIVAQRHQEIIDTRRAAIEGANQAWRTLETARAQIKAFKAAVKANVIALDGVRQEANAGLRTVLDVLDAEQELLNSRVSLVGAERDEIVALYDVMRTMGVLTARNLRLPVEIYDVKKNYRNVKYKPWGPGGSTNSYIRRSRGNAAAKGAKRR